MATSAASIIGRIGIRVHPVSDGFRGEARRQLEGIEKSLDEIKVGITLARHSLAQEARDAVRNAQRTAGDVNVDLKINESDSANWLENRLRNLERDLRVNLGINKERAEREIEDLKDKYDGDNIEFDVKVANLKASLDLARVSRDRNVTLFVNVSKKSMAAAATTLAALSGARLVGDQLDRLWQRIQDLDKSIPMLSALASAFLGVAASVGASFSNISAMVASLMQIFPAALALPGLAGGFAFGLGSAYAVLKDFNDVLPEVADRFSALQGSMSTRFWDRATEPIQSMIDNLFPQLERGLLHTADGLGVFFSAFSRGLDNRLDGYLVPMFRNLQESMNIAARGADALAGVITTLGRTGSQYLPRLADWFRRNVINFDRWLEESYNSGALQGWIDRGIERMHQLWEATRDLGAVIYILGTEAEKAGGAGLQQFAKTMAEVRRVVESKSFLESYRQFINASHGFFEDINTGVSGRFGAFMHTFVDQMTTAFDNLGLSIGNFLGSLYDMLGGQAITKGWDALTKGLATGLDGFSKYMDDIGLGIGALQRIIGTMSANFLPVLGKVFATLGRILHDNAPGIQSAIETLSKSFSDLIDDLTPVAEKLFPILVKALNAIAPYAGELLILAAGLKALKLAASGMGVLRGAASSIASLTASLKASRAVTGAQGALAAWRANPLLASANAGASLGRFVQSLKPLLKLGRAAGIIGLIGTAIKSMWDNSSDFRNGASRLIDSIGSLAGTIARMVDSSPLGGVIDQFGEFWDFLRKFASWIGPGFFGPIARNLGDGLGGILEQVSIMFEGLDALLNGRGYDFEGLDLGKLLGFGSGDGIGSFFNIPKYMDGLNKLAAAGPKMANTVSNLRYIELTDLTPMSRTAKLAALQASRLAQAVEEGKATFFDLSAGVDDASLSLQGWMQQLRDQVNARALWQSNLDQLKAMGLSDAAYEALAGLGEAGALRVQELLDSGTEGIQEFNDLIYDGLGRSGKIASQVLGALPAAVQGAIDRANKAAATFNINEGAWETLGVNAVSGFTRGMSGGQTGVGKTATLIAITARRGISENLDIRSPSRVMHQLGVDAAQGFIDGLNSLLTGTFGASQKLANEVLKGFKGSSGYNAGRTLAMGIRNGMYSYPNAGTGTYVGGRVVAGLKGSNTYSSGRTLAYDLRRGMYSYANAGTGNYVGSRIQAGLRGRSTYQTGRNMAADLRKGMYSYPNAGSGAEVARRAARAMSGFSAYNSGYAIAKSFANGLNAGKNLVAQKAKGVVQAARKYFPNSPADEGPFSGSGWIDKSGLAIGEAFAKGMELSTPKVRMAALAMADAASAATDVNMTGLNAAISTDNQHVISLANTPVTLTVDGRPMQAYIREGVDSGMEKEGRTLKYASSWRQ